MPRPARPDLLVLGGGVIGLSIAERLAREGMSVTLIDRGEPGREASWAGAGILPPASWYVDHPALDTLCRAADPMHAELSARLLDETGLDDQYTRCGAEYQRTAENAPRVDAVLARWRRLGVELLETNEPGASTTIAPAEAQVRNPRRLRALLASCRRNGVRVEAGVGVEDVERQGDRITHLRTTAGDFQAGAFCFAAGCWTPGLAEQAGFAAPGRPIRGQMIVLRLREPLPRILHRYPYYAVPRRDGRVLVGATLETAGFDKQTTDAALAELRGAAARLHPTLADAPIETQWSGLRPAPDGLLPLIGPAPGLANAWVATGHHRSGLQLAPPTAQVIAAMIRGEPAGLPTAPFDPGRFAEPSTLAAL